MQSPGSFTYCYENNHRRHNGNTKAFQQSGDRVFYCLFYAAQTLQALTSTRSVERAFGVFDIYVQVGYFSKLFQVTAKGSAILRIKMFS